MSFGCCNWEPVHIQQDFYFFNIRPLFWNWVRFVRFCLITSLIASYCEQKMPSSAPPVTHVIGFLHSSHSASLSLSFPPDYVPHLWALWWCFSAQNGFTSSKTSLLYLYFTTPLETHASWAAEVWAEKRKKQGRRASEKEREQWKMVENW